MTIYLGDVRRWRREDRSRLIRRVLAWVLPAAVALLVAWVVLGTCGRAP